MLASSSGLGGSKKSVIGGLRGLKNSISSANGGRMSYMQGMQGDSLKLQMIRLGENKKHPDRKSGNHASFIKRKLASIAESKGLGPRTVLSSQYTGSDNEEEDDEYYLQQEIARMERSVANKKSLQYTG